MRDTSRKRRAAVDERHSPRAGSGPDWLGAVLTGLGGASIGYAIAFLVDPERGRARRARVIDQGAATGRRVRRTAERSLRAVTSTVEGKVQAIAHGGTGVGPIDDVTLRDRAETQLFRDPAVPKGTININVERGILVLRGEVPDAAMRERLERDAERIDGVWSVRNLLHLPGEPAEELAANTG